MPPAPQESKPFRLPTWVLAGLCIFLGWLLGFVCLPAPKEPELNESGSSERPEYYPDTSIERTEWPDDDVVCYSGGIGVSCVNVWKPFPYPDAGTEED